jgi:isopentenyl-diphosphate Delta-isomerase
MHKQVSFDDEMLILVNPKDEEIGWEDKARCHLGDGILHRAFSIFIFNDNNELLIQKRSDQKLLWPLFWSNSCCSHPRKGEKIESAAQRRLEEELGIKTRLKYLYKFQYQAAFKDVGSENELCSVFIGKSDGQVQVNKNEIAEWKYLKAENLDTELTENPGSYTPWFKMEWARLRNTYWQEIKQLQTNSSP